jgi:3-keto-5-aminohexanoate cleavage enzyme
MPARLIDLDHLLSTIPEGASWGGAGIGRFQLPINLASIIKGGHVRVGLEDNIHYNNERTELATNPMLVERLAKFARHIGREIALPEEARQIIDLPVR